MTEVSLQQKAEKTFGDCIMTDSEIMIVLDKLAWLVGTGAILYFCLLLALLYNTYSFVYKLSKYKVTLVCIFYILSITFASIRVAQFITFTY